MNANPQLNLEPHDGAARGQPLVSVRDLHTWYPIRRGVFMRVADYVKAVDGLSFDIPPRKTLALVG